MVNVKKEILGGGEWTGKWNQKYDTLEEFKTGEKLTDDDITKLLTDGYVTVDRKHGFYRVQFSIV